MKSNPPGVANPSFYLHKCPCRQGALVQKADPWSGALSPSPTSLDTLTSRRSYKAPCRAEQALNTIRGNSGTHFDPDVVGTFFAVEDKILAISQKHRDKREGKLPLRMVAAMGAKGYLSKPFTQQDVLDVIIPLIIASEARLSTVSSGSVLHGNQNQSDSLYLLVGRLDEVVLR